MTIPYEIDLEDSSPCRDGANGIGRCAPDPYNDSTGLSCPPRDPIETNISN